MSNENVVEGFKIVHQLFKGGLKQGKRVKLLAKLGRIIRKIEKEPKKTVVKEVVKEVVPLITDRQPVDARGHIVVGKTFRKHGDTIIASNKSGSEIVPTPQKIKI